MRDVLQRTIDTHHDGHGLNESIEIHTDQPDASGAAHHYAFWMHVGNGQMQTPGYINFQQGPRGEEGSTPGITEAALLAVLIDRLRSYPQGALAKSEKGESLVNYGLYQNGRALDRLEEVLLWVKARADERAKRGVLGRNAK